MVFLVVLVVAVVVVVLVMRAAAAPGGPGGRPARPAPPRRPRPQRPTRPLAPDDDPEFLRELERRTRRDDGSPARPELRRPAQAPNSRRQPRRRPAGAGSSVGAPSSASAGRVARPAEPAARAAPVRASPARPSLLGVPRPRREHRLAGASAAATSGCGRRVVAGGVLTHGDLRRGRRAGAGDVMRAWKHAGRDIRHRDARPPDRRLA